MDQVTPPCSAAGHASTSGASARLGVSLGGAQPLSDTASGVCLVSRAVEALGDQHRFHPAVKSDVEREIRLRQRKASINEPSLRGTLGAETSWVVPEQAVDGRQHRGASSFQSPFVPQLLRPNTEIDLERQARVAERDVRPEAGTSSAGLQSGPAPHSRAGSSFTQWNRGECDFETLFRSDSLGPAE